MRITRGFEGWLLVELLAEVFADELAAGLDVGLLGGDVGVGEMSPDGDQRDARREAAGRRHQLPRRWGKLPHDSQATALGEPRRRRPAAAIGL